MILRKATERDVDLFFRWANDHEVRKNSFQQHQIKYQDHKQWFAEKINSENCLLFVLEDGVHPVGQARIDITDGEGVIDYSIDKLFRGRRFGSLLLSEVIGSILAERNPIHCLKAVVKRENVASQKTLEKIGFTLKQEDQHSVTYHLNISEQLGCKNEYHHCDD